MAGDRGHGLTIKRCEKMFWCYVSVLSIYCDRIKAYKTEELKFVCFISLSQSCLTLCNPMNHSTTGLPVYHQLLEFTQTHVHRVSGTVQPSHPLSPPPPALNLFHHQGLFQWVGSSNQVAKVLELQLQHQSFQWILRVDFKINRIMFVCFQLPVADVSLGWL